jgi:hypothetical protein
LRQQLLHVHLRAELLAAIGGRRAAEILEGPAEDVGVFRNPATSFSENAAQPRHTAP